MSSNRHLSLLKWLFIEEMRFYEQFSRRSLIGFSVLMFLLSSTLLYSMYALGGSVSLVVYTSQIFLTLAGLQIATVAFVLGDQEFGIFEGKQFIIENTQYDPLSHRSVYSLAIFKDLVFYGVLFVIPVLLSLFTVVAIIDFALLVTGGVSLLVSSVLLFLLVGMFSLALVTVLQAAQRVKWWLLDRASRVEKAGFVGVFSLSVVSVSVLAVYAFIPGYDPSGTILESALNGIVIGYSSIVVALSLFIEPFTYIHSDNHLPILGLSVSIIIGFVFSILISNPSTARHETKAVISYTALKRLPFIEGTAVGRKTLIDVIRSTGGLWKVVFSLGFVFVFSISMYEMLRSSFGFSPDPALFFAALVSIYPYLVWSWSTSISSPESYQRYPVALSEVLRQKATIVIYLSLIGSSLLYFVLLGLTTEVSVLLDPYVMTFGVYEITNLTILLGYSLLVVLNLYTVCVTVYFTGFDTDAVLLDWNTLVKFSVVLMLPFLLVIIGSFYHPNIPEFPLTITLFYSITGYGAYYLFEKKATNTLG